MRAALTRSARPCHKGAKIMRKRAAIIEIFRVFRRPRAAASMALAAALAVLTTAGFAEAMNASEKPAAPAQILAPPDGKAAPVEKTVGTASGLPVPRYVSLKSGRINVRRGPGDDYPIEWIFEKKGLPVEITAESDRWRRIRDREGDVGWVWHSMLDGRRTGIVENKTGDGTPVALHAEANPQAPIVAYAEPGVVAQLAACKNAWCELKAGGYEGWIERDEVWGTYPDENFE
jgi:SH3-like domain-containing protein